MDYIGSLNTAPSPNFVVIVAGSETAIVSNVRDGTLRDHGLIGPVQLYVTWDVTDQDELFQVICCVTLHVVGAVESCCLHLQKY